MPSSPARARIGIVGSAGRYGRWFARFLAAHPGLAAEVRGHDPADPEADAADALAAWADVLVFCTPVAGTTAAIGRFARLAPARAPAQLWMDLCSIKLAPMAAMMASGAEVLGLHPMCAPPEAPDLRGQRLVVCEGRLRQWRPWCEALLAATAADCVRLEPEEHDRRAALVQGLGHAAHLAHLLGLARSGLAPAELRTCATPTFELDLAIGMRLLAGDPTLYAGLLALTPQSRAAVAALRAACDELLALSAGEAAAAALATRIAELRRWAGAAAIEAGEQDYLRAIAALHHPRD
jgi:prephenate dehydrogenase